MAVQRDNSKTPDLPILSLALGESSTTAELVDDGKVLERQLLDGAGYDRLLSLLECHRAGLVDAARAQPFDLWQSGTERFLAVVYELISQPLISWCRCYGAVGLRLDHPILDALPVETAHIDQEAALFEHIQISRAPLSQCSTTGLQRQRRFELEVWIGNDADLGSVPLERMLVEAAHGGPCFAATRRREEGGRTKRAQLVHLAGHQPQIEPGRLDRSAEAHVVLSGCDSLPSRLPDGVASATGSLWPVEDQANVSLMAALHARLAFGLGPSEALRQAQILHRGLPPTTWAAYVHLGSTS